MRLYGIAHLVVATSDLNARIQVCWIPILKAKKLILAGDNLQLPPTVKSIDKKDKKSKANASAKTTGKTTPKGKPTATDVKAKGKAKAIPQPPAPASIPVSDGEGDDDASDEEEDVDETEPSPVSALIGGKPKKPQQLGILRPSKSLGVTLFDRMEKMWGKDIKQMLTIQYR